MAEYLVMYNPLSNNKKGLESAHEIEKVFENSTFEYKSVLEIKSYAELFESTPAEKTLVLAGGDGTVNHFVNNTDGLDITRTILYFPAGSGNDFMRDVSEDGSKKYVELNPYMKDLPFVEVNGVKKRFINGIGYGIDGYCCEVGDKLREADSDKPINYTSIAIKGLLFHFSPVTATVTIDGNTSVYKNAWLVPTMNGRFYGGGMNACPKQDRLSDKKTLSTMVFMGKGRLKTLMIFPSIFKGEHVNHTKQVKIFEGKEIIVTFDRPCALQIDGETVLNVSSYRVYR